MITHLFSGPLKRLRSGLSADILSASQPLETYTNGKNAPHFPGHPVRVASAHYVLQPAKKPLSPLEKLRYGCFEYVLMPAAPRPRLEAGCRSVSGRRVTRKRSPGEGTFDWSRHPGRLVMIACLMGLPLMPFDAKLINDAAAQTPGPEPIPPTPVPPPTPEPVPPSPIPPPKPEPIPPAPAPKLQPPVPPSPDPAPMPQVPQSPRPEEPPLRPTPPPPPPLPGNPPPP